MTDRLRLDADRAAATADRIWEDQILPALRDYIRIPNRSPGFDPEWAARGDMDRAVDLVASWCRDHALPGMSVEVTRLPGRTPLILMEVPGDGEDTVLLYGHLDKQPEMTGWREGLDPWEPVREGDRLYGRGGADDGYAAFASLAALRLLQEQGIPHARCVILVEACEESGSVDLPAYIEALADRIGQPSLVVCLDSGCGNYDQLWFTTSLRGLVGGDLTVRVLREGVHSGDASGVVPSSFRILRSLLSRLEDEATGRILLPALHAPIPEVRVRQARQTAASLGEAAFGRFPWAGDTRPMGEDVADRILARTWRPTLSVTGLAGAPAPGAAGNVLRPSTTARLSIRIPAGVDPRAATAAVKEALEADPPYGAEVHFRAEEPASGWNAPPMPAWLEGSLDAASRTWFGLPSAAMGEGGTIPFMAMLGERFPAAQFLITGVLGPESNAHGPNEFLHLPTGKRLTCCVAEVIAAHRAR